MATTLEQRLRRLERRYYARVFDEWKEEEHKRDKSGKFSKNSTSPIGKKIDLGSIFDQSIGGGGNKLFADFSIVNNKTVELAKETIGLDISGWKHSIDEAGIRHIMKQHGNEKIEANRGQRAVTKYDIEKLPEILDSFDSIEYTGTNELGNETFLIRKKIDGEVFCIQEVRKRRKKLAVKTMWIRKK